MENPYESLPMGTDSCDGIKDICEKTTKLMGDIWEIAKKPNY